MEGSAVAQPGIELSDSRSHSQAQSDKFERPAFKFDVSPMDRNLLAWLLQQISNPRLLDRQFDSSPCSAFLSAVTSKSPLCVDRKLNSAGSDPSCGSVEMILSGLLKLKVGVSLRD